MKKLSAILTTLLLLMFASLSLAGTSEVIWSNPDDYRDVHAGEGHRSKFKARVFASFDAHFAQLAEKLPDGQTLLIDVTNVDLAGDVNHGGMHRIRVIKELFIPRMAFSYQLVDQNKQVINSGDVNLKDMGFMMGSKLRYRNDTLAYEKKMLDDWFAETFTKKQ